MSTSFVTIWSGHEQPKPLHKQSERSRASTAAGILHHILKYWRRLADEEVQAETDARKAPFSMHQFRFLFNTARAPGEHRDSIRAHFEEKLNSQVAVSCGGRYFRVEPFHADGRPWSPIALERYFESVEKYVENNPVEKGHVAVAGLTCAKRPDWARVRLLTNQLFASISQKLFSQLEEKMSSHSKRNAENLKTVHSSILTVALDDSEPADDEALFKLLTAGPELGAQWADKTLELVATANGLCGTRSEV